MISVIDSHVHVWNAERAHYSWLAEVPELPRTIELAEFWPDQAAVGVSAVVLVQAADNVEDTENMLRAAAAHPQVAGVVAWLPLRDPAAAARLLGRWHGEPLVGVRHLAHRDPDRDLFRHGAVNETLELLGQRNLAFDLCAETVELLEQVPDLAARHPRTTFVVDHLGKPPIREQSWQPWADLLAAAAEPPNVVAKVSGLNTAAARDWVPSDLAPYIGHALSTFGPQRLMYGGDWPFAMLAADSYRQVWEGIAGGVGPLSDEDRRAVFGDTARRIYALGESSRAIRGAG